MDCLNSALSTAFRGCLYLTPFGDIYKSYTIFFEEEDLILNAPQNKKIDVKTSIERDDYYWAVAKIIVLISFLFLFPNPITLILAPVMLTTGFLTITCIFYAKCKRPVSMMRGVERSPSYNNK